MEWKKKNLISSLQPCYLYSQKWEITFDQSSRIGKQMIGQQNLPTAHLHCPSLPFLKLIGQPLNTISFYKGRFDPTHDIPQAAANL